MNFFMNFLLTLLNTIAHRAMWMMIGITFFYVLMTLHEGEYPNHILEACLGIIFFVCLSELAVTKEIELCRGRLLSKEKTRDES